VSYTASDAVDSIFVPAGTTFSTIDQETANELAVQSAANVPNCQFENAAQEVSCAELFGGDFRDSVLFSWPTLQSPQTTKISDIGGHVILQKNGSVSPFSVSGYRALTYEEVAARGTAAVKRELVLKVSVPVGLTTGNTQAEADAKARAVALSYLSCFIPARRRSLKCTDEVVSEPAFTQAQSSSDNEVLSEIVTGYTTLASLLPTIKPDNVTIIEATTGPEIDTRVAVRLHLPEGAFVADSRQVADATAEAFTLASAATNLDCAWSNRRVTYACDDKSEFINASHHLDDSLFAGYGVDGQRYDGPFKIDFKRGQMIDIYQLGLVELMAVVDKSDPYFVSVERNEFDSPNSQDDADRIAAAHAMSLLDCVYCNPRIEPNCPPDDYTPDESLPLAPSDDGYSFDTTRGVPGIPYFNDETATPPRWRIIGDQGEVPQGPLESEAWICSTEPVDVARVAGDDGGTTLRSLDTSLECRYCNDFITAACCYDGTDPTINKRFGPEECAQLAVAFDNFTVGECAGNQISDPYAQVAIPGCSMFAESKEAANELALNIAWAQLSCMFANETYEATCESTCENLVNVPFSIQVGNNTYNGLHVGPVFVGVETATIEAGLFRSTCSKEQADLQASAMAEAQLVCLWTNNAQTANCPISDSYHETAITTVTIPAGTIVTDNCTPYANEIALKMAAMQLFCAYTNDPYTYDDCPPGYKLITEGFVAGGTIVALTKEGANSIADSIAKASKVCEQEFFGNDRQVDNQCPVGSPTGIGNCPGSGGAATYELVEAGIVEADTIIALTKARANAIAKGIAAASKICQQKFFGNNQQTYSQCPPGFKLATPGVVNSCTVIAQSQAQANAIASGIARASVVCELEIFCNDPQTYNQCPKGFKLITAGTVAGGEICATKKETANAIARGIARASVVCELEIFGNDPQTYSQCPPGFKLVTEGTVAGNTIFASTKAQANAIASGIARASIVCEFEIFCNDPQTYDKCPPGFKLVTAGTVAGGEICAPKKETANAIALGIARASVVCEFEIFGNDPQTYDQCPPGFKLVTAGTVAGNTIFAPKKETANAIALGIARASVVCELEIFCNDPQSNASCPAGMETKMVGTVAGGEICAPKKETANAIARGIAAGLKVCAPKVYTNKEVTIDKCPVPSRQELLVAGYVLGGVITAYDQSTADSIARSIAKANTICTQKIFKNGAQTGTANCEPPDTPKNTTVAGNTVSSFDSVAEANSIAKGIADALSFCKPGVYKNATAMAQKQCTEPEIAYNHTVRGGTITSYVSEADATSIAKGIADAVSFCKPFMLPQKPTTGTYVLGVVSGTIQWLPTEEC
jgi:hypothetical protein